MNFVRHMPIGGRIASSFKSPQALQAAVATIPGLEQAIDAYLATVQETGGLLQALGQMNANLVEQSAAAAESLRQQAASLTELLGVFTLPPAATALR